MDKKNIENSLIVPEKENVFTKLFKWIKGVFVKNDLSKNNEINNALENQFQDITIPQNVKIPARIERIDENSLEYLYNLSDEELDNLNNLYDTQMEEQKAEALRLEDILQTYKQTIKKMQGEVETEF